MLARGQAGLTQEALGGPDLTKSFISLLEGGRSYPSVETVMTLARRLGTSVASLLMDGPELRIETALTLLRLAATMDLRAHGKKAVQLVAAAQALLPDTPAELAIRAALVRAHVAIAGDRLDEAAQWADEAAAVASRQRLASLLGMALGCRGLVEVRRGRYAHALPTLEKAVETLRDARAVRTEENVRALLSLGAAQFYLGHLDRARRSYRRAADLAARLLLHGLRGRALTGLAQIERARARPDAAAELLSRAHDALALAEDLAEMSRALSNLGVVRREQGRFHDAVAAFERALRIREQIGDRRGRGATREEMALALLALGRHADAARAARGALQDARAVGDEARAAWAQIALARIQAAQHRRSDAVHLLRDAVSTLERLGLEREARAVAGDLGLLLSDAVGLDAAKRPIRALGHAAVAHANSSRPSLLEGPAL
jgi:tetratricopeptide (TPR) repeat protein